MSIRERGVSLASATGRLHETDHSQRPASAFGEDIRVCSRKSNRDSPGLVSALHLGARPVCGGCGIVHRFSVQICNHCSSLLWMVASMLSRFGDRRFFPAAWLGLARYTSIEDTLSRPEKRHQSSCIKYPFLRKR